MKGPLLDNPIRAKEREDSKPLRKGVTCIWGSEITCFDRVKGTLESAKPGKGKETSAN